MAQSLPVQGTHLPDGSQQTGPPPVQRVVSPFAHSSVAPQAATQRKVPLTWLLIAAAVLLAAGGTGFALTHFASDPYRTLEPFPLETYVGNYHALEGSRFKATLRVENDLGYNAATGRLMVFSIEGDGRTVAALVPTRLADNLFSRGQRYTAELQVGSGGLIQVNGYVKN